MGRKKKHRGLGRYYSGERLQKGGILEQETVCDWRIQIPQKQMSKTVNERLAPFVLYLMVVLGSGLAVLEMLEPDIDPGTFLGGLLLFSCLWQGIYWNKKTCAWGQLILWAAVAVVCWFNWERLLTGGRMTANIILTKLNIIYDLSLGTFVVDKPDTGAIFLFLSVIFCWLIGMMGACTLYRLSVSWLAVIVILLISGGLWIGEIPSQVPFFLMMGAVYGSAVLFYGRRLPGSRIQRRAGLLTLMALGLVLALGQWVFSPMVEPGILAHHDTVESLEQSFEKWLWEDGLGKFDFLESLGPHDFTDGALSNASPEFDEQRALTVRTDRKPQRNLYLRGYAGELYTGQRWTEVSGEDFYQEVKQWQGSWINPGLQVQDMYRRVLTANVQKWGSLNDFTTEFTLEYERVDGDYSFLPYEAQLTDEVSEEGDGWTLRREENITVQGILPDNFYYSLDISPDLQEEDRQLLAEYEEYVSQHYRSIPAEGVERLMEYAQELRGRGLTRGELIAAVQEELKNRCRYSTNLDPIPQGEDFAEYFFFESQEGFCTHFATTAVLLYRMAGLPARYRTGYVVPVQSFQQQENGSWEAEVMDSQAHAWVEVYLSGYGWIPVEVTPGYESGDGSLQEETETETFTLVPEETITPTPTESAESNEQSGDDSAQELQGGAEGPENIQVDTKISKALEVLATIGKFLLAAAVIVAIILLRRMLLVSKRLALLNQKDPGKAILQISYRLQEILEEGGIKLSRELYDLDYGRQMAEHFPQLDKNLFSYFVRTAQKAAFSEENCTVQEVRWCRSFYHQIGKILWEQLPWWKKLWWRYIKCF